MTIAHETTYPHPAARVWETLNDIDTWPTWLGTPVAASGTDAPDAPNAPLDGTPPAAAPTPTPSEPDTRLYEGREVQLQPHDAPGPVLVRVLHLDAPHEAVLLWAPPGEAPSLVEWRVQPLPDGGSQLRIRHSGLQVPRMHAGGWHAAAQRLYRHLPYRLPAHRYLALRHA